MIITGFLGNFRAILIASADMSTPVTSTKSH